MIEKFKIQNYKFSVRETRNGKTMKVNEYTFRNLQLQVACSNITPFWFLSIDKKWLSCKEDGYLPKPPYSKGFEKDPYDFMGTDSALGVSDDLCIKLFMCRSKSPKTDLKIPKVDAPYFKIDGQSVNEYQLRAFCCEVREGLHGNREIPVSDTAGNSTVIRTDGIIKGTLSGLNLTTQLAVRLLSTPPVNPIK